MPASEKEPTAALVIVGNEILSGKIDDANGPFLIRGLRARGIETVEVRTVSDDVALIANAVRELSPRVAHLFTSGGIGPTHDDVTAAGVARAFAVPLVRDAEIEQRKNLRRLDGSEQSGFQSSG